MFFWSFIPSFCILLLEKKKFFTYLSTHSKFDNVTRNNVFIVDGLSMGYHPPIYIPPLPLPCCHFPGTLSAAGLSLPYTLPIFTPTSVAGTHHAGLDLLASAALTHPLTSTGDPPLAPVRGLVLPSAALSSQGPYHPAAVLPPKVAKRILDLEYV